MVQPGGGREAPAAAIGTGPYKLTQFQAGVRAEFEKNQDDWRNDRGHVDSAEIIVINDDTARIAALSSGRVDLIDSVNPKTVPLLERAPGTHQVGWFDSIKPTLGKKEASRTPEAFAAWLIELA